MSREQEIARALGYRKDVRLLAWISDTISDETLSDKVCAEEDLDRWIDSLEGQAAIRDRVRELCRERDLLIVIELHPIWAESIELRDINKTLPSGKYYPVWWAANCKTDIWGEALLWLDRQQKSAPAAATD